MIVCICNPRILVVRWETEAGEFLGARGLASLRREAANERPVSHKVAGEDWPLMCPLTLIHAPWHLYTQIYRFGYLLIFGSEADQVFTK